MSRRDPINPLDRAISFLAPGWGARRMRARAQLRLYTGAYEAAHPSHLRKWSRDYGSGTNISKWAQQPLRITARDLERNSDIARNIISVLVRNLVGANGIQVEPQPAKADGTIHDDFARQILAYHRDWSENPEVSSFHDRASMERMVCRSWVRDGEALAQVLMGTVPFLNHGTHVPLSLELLECDLLPLYLDDEARGITQGVERNAWGQPTGYWVLKAHPGDYQKQVLQTDVKRIDARNMRHVKLIDRMGQVRGISLFASILNRLRDIKDYEDSERIAAKIAASFAAVIIKGSPDGYMKGTDDNPTVQRDMQLQAGAIFDNLREGEDVRTIDSKRPSPLVNDFLSGQLRRLSGGVEVSFSSAAKDYNGTYSAQRQELVEQFGAYGVLSAEMINQFCRPNYQDFVAVGIASGKLKVPKDVDPLSLDHAIYTPPAMPWIDPLKEAEANEMLEQAGFADGPSLIRRSGRNPREVLQAEQNWRQQAEEAGLSFTTFGAAAAVPRFGNSGLPPDSQTAQES